MNLIGKKVSYLIMLGIFGLTLAACGEKKKTEFQSVDGSSEEAESDEIIGTVVVYTDQLDLIKNKFAEYKMIFEQDNPGTEVVFKAYSDYDQTVSKQLKEGDYGDVVLIPQNLDSEELSAYFEPLGTVEELSEDYKEEYLHAAEWDGVVYGLAQYAMPQGIAYNKKVFEKAGIIQLPGTSEEFLKALKAIKDSEPEVLPIFIGQRRTESIEWWQQQVLGQIQAGAVSDNGADSSGVQEITEQRPFAKGKPAYMVCKLLYDIVEQGLSEEGGISPGWKQVREMLNNGEIGCVPVEWSQLSAMRQAAPNPDDIGYMPFPCNQDVQYAVTVLGYCYGINKNSENKATARAWIDYIMNSSGYAKSEGAVSIQKKDGLPDLLVNFENTIPIVYKASDDMDWSQDNIDGYLDLIEAAGKEENTLEDIMQDFDKKWKKAIQGKDSSK